MTIVKFLIYMKIELMIIKRTSIISGKSSTMDLPVTQRQMDMWNSGMCVQDCMPHLEIEQREFLITGMSIEEQNKFFNSIIDEKW